ncbi:MAG: hypothetical protein HYT61_00260 [Candidatus Yanofskybacteria bacterium]|nr:hypothetical protein [Candidatus Yanofskybacteria bacterium]
MKKITFTFLLIISILLGVYVPLANAAEFSFSDNFSENYNIDTSRSNYKFANGMISAPDNVISTNIVSVPLINTYYNIGSARLEVSDYSPAGGRIVYFISNNNGNTWTETTKNVFVNFSSLGNSARWMATIGRANINSASPEIHSIKLTVRESGSVVSSYYYGTSATTDFGNFAFKQNVVPDNELNSVLGRQVFTRSGFLATNSILNTTVVQNNTSNANNNTQVAGASINKVSGVATGTTSSLVLSLLISTFATIIYMTYTQTDLFKNREALAVVKKHRSDKNRFNFL